MTPPRKANGCADRIPIIASVDIDPKVELSPKVVGLDPRTRPSFKVAVVDYLQFTVVTSRLWAPRHLCAALPPA
jgi:hypothetical protein